MEKPDSNALQPIETITEQCENGQPIEIVIDLVEYVDFFQGHFQEPDDFYFEQIIRRYPDGRTEELPPICTVLSLDMLEYMCNKSDKDFEHPILGYKKI